MRILCYGSSSKKTPKAYLDVAHRLGQLIAARGGVCVHGGGASGCMGALHRGCVEADGVVDIVVHEKWVDGEVVSKSRNCKVAKGDNLQERKRLLVESSDVAVALPGGCGTWDELWELCCLRQIGFASTKHIRAVVLVNAEGYYDGTLMQLERAQKDGILHVPYTSFLDVVKTAEEAIEVCARRCRGVGESREEDATDAESKVVAAVEAAATKEV